MTLTAEGTTTESGSSSLRRTRRRGGALGAGETFSDDVTVVATSAEFRSDRLGSGPGAVTVAAASIDEAVPAPASFVPPPDKPDPWSLLDPHDAPAGRRPRPLRIGITYRLPRGVEVPPSACVTGAHTKTKMDRSEILNKSRMRMTARRDRVGKDGGSMMIAAAATVATMGRCFAVETFEAGIANVRRMEDEETRKKEEAAVAVAKGAGDADPDAATAEAEGGGKEDCEAPALAPPESTPEMESSFLNNTVGEDDDDLPNAAIGGGATISGPPIPDVGLIFGDEFAYIARATVKQRAKERRERSKNAVLAGGGRGDTPPPSAGTGPQRTAAGSIRTPTA